MNPSPWATAHYETTAPGLDPTLLPGRIGMSPLTGVFPFRVVALDPRVRLVEAIMYHNLSRALPLAELSQRTGMSISRLSHLFKIQVGTSPRQYLKSLRLRRAKYLLESSLLSVKEVAFHVGLTAGALIRDFRRAYGCSPGRHRNGRAASHPGAPEVARSGDLRVAGFAHE